MTHVIAPNRFEKILENDKMSTRFAQYMESLERTVNNLSFRPVNTQDANYTFVLADAGAIVRKTSVAAAQTYTIAASDSVQFPIGTYINIQNDGISTLKVAIITDTLTSSAGLGTGPRTVGVSGEATLVKVDATNWKISGEQIT